MRRAYTQGFVSKHGGKWRAVVNWQGEDGRQHRLTKTTGVRCYPDRVDEATGEVTPDNRGRASAETALRRWRDELVASEEERSRLGGRRATPPSPSTRSCTSCARSSLGRSVR